MNRFRTTKNCVWKIQLSETYPLILLILNNFTRASNICEIIFLRGLGEPHTLHYLSFSFKKISVFHFVYDEIGPGLIDNLNATEIATEKIGKFKMRHVWFNEMKTYVNMWQSNGWLEICPLDTYIAPCVTRSEMAHTFHSIFLSCWKIAAAKFSVISY